MKILDLNRSLNISVDVLKKYVDFLFLASAFSETLQKKYYVNEKQLHKILSRDFERLTNNCQQAYNNFNILNQEAIEIFNTSCKISDMYKEFPDCDLHGENVLFLQNTMAGLSKEKAIHALRFKYTEVNCLIGELSKYWVDKNFDKFSKTIKFNTKNIFSHCKKIRDIIKYAESKEKNLE